jgi:alpha-L-fucosidase
MNRRKLIKQLAAAMPALWMTKGWGAGGGGNNGNGGMGYGARGGLAGTGGNLMNGIAPGPFKADWESLKQYKAPEWFRDAKFGIWAHWSAQCVPEQGDWYARQMYIQGTDQNKYHVEHYGHPSKFGFMEVDNLWKAENWDPEALMKLYVAAGAKYFVSLANHHDNFDNYDSAHHAWNSLRVGPGKDVIGTWAKAARKHGLRFGVSNHSAHSWHWLQTAYDYDPEGPLAGIRYDAYRLTKAEGKGTWWEGLDPQELYVGPNMVMPDGIGTIQAANAWHDQNDRRWTETPPPHNPAFARSWFLRCKDLVDKYKPDLIYFDNTELPLGQAGLDITAHYYNSNITDHGGKLEAVVNSKGLQPDHMGTMVLDIERGRADKILADPWQTDTCIGDWHYRRSLFENHSYKTAALVIHMLIDIVSKNGNLLLSIPVRGDGTIDADEHKFLEELAGWMPANGEAIFGTRPFSIYGEGQQDVKGTDNFNEKLSRPYTAEDIRFTTKGEILYAMALGWPDDGKLRIRTLARGNGAYPRDIGRIELLGHGQYLTFSREAGELQVILPEGRPNEFAYSLKIIPA